MSLAFLLLFVLTFSINHYQAAIIIGLAVIVLFYIFVGLSGSHFLPIVSLGFFSSGRMPLHIMILYIIVQILGITLSICIFYTIFSSSFHDENEENSDDCLNIVHLLLYGTISFILVLVYLLASGNEMNSFMTGFIVGLTYTVLIYLITMNNSYEYLHFHTLIHIFSSFVAIIIGSVLAGFFYKLLLIEDLPKIGLNIKKTEIVKEY
jgi:glycerol uptake facilitator-like aquaporin